VQFRIHCYISNSKYKRIKSILKAQWDVAPTLFLLTYLFTVEEKRFVLVLSPKTFSNLLQVYPLDLYQTAE